jgi:WS/DGAT/MGAT family acyltransferase
MAARIHLVPYLARKIQFIPGGFDHPVWVNADDFDINDHIEEVKLPGTGDDHQLESCIADIHSGLMDRSKPLWKLIVITGLEDGNIAFYNQVHHACIDGMAGQAATQILMDTTPDHPAHAPPAGFPRAENPGLIDLYISSIQNLVNTQLKSALSFFNGVDSLARITQRIIDPSKSFGAVLESAPDTVFNKSIGKERSFAFGEFPLDSVKATGKSVGCKVNDVFLAICAGGLRKYLQRNLDLPNHELPNHSLIAGCPVSLRKPGDDGMDNQVTMMSVSLATDIADPRLRLLAIKDSAETAKEVTADFAGSYDPDISLPGLPLVSSTAALIADQLNAADLFTTPINVVISNVPGPRETLYSNGARMLTHYPVSVPAHGLGLNITVQSYRDTLYFGVTACKKALPEAALLRDDMLEAYRELKLLLPEKKVTELNSGLIPTQATTPTKAAVVQMDQVA